MAQQSHEHHYVPRWYQRLFMRPGQTRYFYLDLQPEQKVSDGGVTYTRRNLLQWGTRNCFYERDLYTLKLRGLSSDEIETRFFGAIDSRGRDAVRIYAQLSGFSKDVHDAVPIIPAYMGAQRLRTPAGLASLGSLTRTGNRNELLFHLQHLFQFHTTMWMEGIWEVVRARKSRAKFIVSDHPVTFYNRRIFPSETKGTNTEFEQGRVATRTIFPLSIDACLIVTHLQYVRNPWMKPVDARTNARSFAPTLRYTAGTQFDRELDDDEVLRVNYILKKRAHRYIAAAEKDWLYPERYVSTTNWSKLDDDWFLLPNPWKVPFTGQVTVGYKDGSAWSMDEYGRTPQHSQFKDKALHDREWQTRLSAQREWAKKRAGKSAARIYSLSRDNDVADKMIEEFLASQAGAGCRVPHIFAPAKCEN